MDKLNQLSRAEMKNVLGGEDSNGCSTAASCAVYDSTTGTTYSGVCSSDLYTICECVSDYGPYNSSHYSCQDN